MGDFEKFVQLHHNDTPFIIGNCWDVTGALIFERRGFKAIATSSRAIALSMGYEDGEKIPFDLLLQVAKQIKKAITLPLSVDMESGYSNTVTGIVENIEKLHDIGVVGINLEDSLKDGTDGLQPKDAFQNTLASVVNSLSRKNIKMFINARTDTYLIKMPDALTETLPRIKAYEQAGASGIFVPFICNKEDIKKVTAATTLPLNVLSMAGLPSFSDLAKLGVKRMSLGSSLYEWHKRAMGKLIDDFIWDQSFDKIFG